MHAHTKKHVYVYAHFLMHMTGTGINVSKYVIVTGIFP